MTDLPCPSQSFPLLSLQQISQKFVYFIVQPKEHNVVMLNLFYCVFLGGKEIQGIEFRGTRPLSHIPSTILYFI